MEDPSNRCYEATPARMARARAAGEIAVSQELTGAIVALSACVVMIVHGKAMLGGLVVFMRDTVSSLGGGPSPRLALLSGVRVLACALAPVLVVMVGVAALAGGVQTRGHMILAGRPDGEHMGPHLAPRAGLAVVGRGVAKATLMLVLGGVCLALGAPAMFRWGTLPELADRLFVTVRNLVVVLALGRLVFGLADYLGRRHRQRKALRMTRAEAARERRESEGDPARKAERQCAHVEWWEGDRRPGEGPGDVR
ncbi:MAG: EscU/YscU/HrcU family type III secretion system export apparatus switch protein [Polyangia bacterium]|jgi:flagellar biosynthetic protein FlhB